MKKWKWYLLAFFVAASYCFTFTFNWYVLHLRLPVSRNLCFKTFDIYSESTHWFGFIILSYIFGPITLILGVLDECWQPLVGRIFEWNDIARNLIGAGIGLILRHFFYVKIGRKKREYKREHCNLRLESFYEVCKFNPIKWAYCIYKEISFQIKRSFYLWR